MATAKELRATFRDDETRWQRHMRRCPLGAACNHAATQNREASRAAVDAAVVAEGPPAPSP